MWLKKSLNKFGHAKREMYSAARRHAHRRSFWRHMCARVRVCLSVCLSVFVCLCICVLFTVARLLGTFLYVFV